MSNSNKEPNKEPKKLDIGKTIFVYCSGNGVVAKIYRGGGNEDKEPKEVPCLFIRVDDLTEYPLQIYNHPEQLSSIVNSEYQINFEDEASEEEFFNDLFYYIEEFFETPEEDRITTSNKIVNLEDELITLQQGEKE